MERKMTINILGHKFEFTIKSEQQEINFRKAEEIIRQELEHLKSRVPKYTNEQLFALYCLKTKIDALNTANDFNKLKTDAQTLHTSIQNYLEKNK